MRLFQSGFELNSTTAGMEWDSIAGSATVSSSIKRTGGFAGRLLDGAGSGTKWEQRITSSNGDGPWYARVYINVANFGTSYTAPNPIISFVQDSGNTAGQIRLNQNGKLELFSPNFVGALIVGTTISALSLNTWYCVELYAFKNGTNMELTARLDGMTFATTTTSPNVLTFQYFRLGAMNGTSGTPQDIYFDDVAVNDNTGSFQNSWPGPGGIIHLNPNNQGDANAFATQVGGTAGSANNYTRVNEVPPDDVTSYNASPTLNTEDLFKCDSSGLTGKDKISVVAVGVRMTDLVAADATAAIKVEIEKVSGGTISQSAALIPNSTTWLTNEAGTPNTLPLITYQDPDSVNWNVGTLNSMQIGYKLTTANTRSIAVSNVWASVDYYTPTYVGSMLEMFW